MVLGSAAVNGPDGEFDGEIFEYPRARDGIYGFQGEQCATQNYENISGLISQTHCRYQSWNILLVL